MKKFLLFIRYLLFWTPSLVEEDVNDFMISIASIFSSYNFVDISLEWIEFGKSEISLQFALNIRYFLLTARYASWNLLFFIFPFGVLTKAAVWTNKHLLSRFIPF